MAGTELTSLGVWIEAKLRGVGLVYPIWVDAVHESAAAGRQLLVTYDVGLDRTFHGGARGLTRIFATVRVVDQVGSYYPLRADADLIEKALHGKRGEAMIDGFFLSGCFRESPFRQQIVFKGVEYRQLGGTYRALVGAL